jgi:hypothetical protein
VSDEISSLRNKGISLLKAKNRSNYFPAPNHRIWECKSKSQYEASISSKNARNFAMRKRSITRSDKTGNFHYYFHAITLFNWLST